MKSFGPSFEMTHRSDTDGEVRVIERSNRLTRVRVDNRHYDGAGACVLGLGSFDGFHLYLSTCIASAAAAAAAAELPVDCSTAGLTITVLYWL